MRGIVTNATNRTGNIETLVRLLNSIGFDWEIGDSITDRTL